jgi:metallo-beta-lactamase family protein
MTITFHGAAGCVTGSKHLIKLQNGQQILLDCGLFQGMGKETEDYNRNWGFDPKAIQLMILSHAHIDHSGLLPRLVKDGFEGSIYCTPGTLDLASILLEDSAVIQRDDAKFSNKRRKRLGQPLIEPFYDIADAKKAINQLTPIEYGKWHTINENVSVYFTDAGHIIGSACVHLKIIENGQTKHITFSGDVGRFRDVILKEPETFPQADVILMESTYGDKIHEDSFSSPEALLHFIEETCVKKQGKLIIPAFSVGRTQELLYALNCLEEAGKLPNVPVYVDSPLSSKATQVLKKYPQYFNDALKKVYENDEDPFGFKGLKFIESADESKLLNFNNNPCIIISSSGMADAGRVKHHISHNIENSNNTILLAGYCEPRSLGGQLQSGKKEVKIFGEMHQVNANIGRLKSMSAHGDVNDLIHWLDCQDKYF